MQLPGRRVFSRGVTVTRTVPNLFITLSLSLFYLITELNIFHNNCVTDTCQDSRILRIKKRTSHLIGLSFIHFKLTGTDLISNHALFFSVHPVHLTIIGCIELHIIMILSRTLSYNFFLLFQVWWFLMTHQSQGPGALDLEQLSDLIWIIRLRGDGGHCCSSGSSWSG